MTIGDIARERVVTADPSDTVKSVVEKMAEHDVGCIIIEERNEPIGLVTDRKIALSLKDRPDLTSHPVKEIMTTGLITVHRDDGISETAHTMSEAGIRRLPVVDDHDNLVGIVSMDDLAVLLINELDELQNVVEKQSPRF